jgi:hypothetical protein
VALKPFPRGCMAESALLQQVHGGGLRFRLLVAAD